MRPRIAESFKRAPVIVDPEGPDGKPIAIFESAAILLYLAEKSGRFLPKDIRGRTEVTQWLMFQMAGVGPMFGQASHFLLYASEKIPYAIDRYTNESRRLDESAARSSCRAARPRGGR